MSDKDDSRKEMSEIALDTLLKNICTEEEYGEILDDIEENELRGRMVFDGEHDRFSYAKKKVTDCKGNSRVNFP